MSDSKSSICSDEKKTELWMDGFINTAIGLVPKIRTNLYFKDYLGSVSARLGINRMNYKINPGIYAVGSPVEHSSVFVTANYKLTFDSLRKELSSIDAWILVLDTKGINVWCAAGKGTFGTKELISRIISVRLFDIVKNRVLILPQLGAVGVEAYKVTQFTKFSIKYGPVYARDIREYLTNDMKKTEAMKKVEFKLKDRVVLVPMEIANATVYLLISYLIAFGLDILKNMKLSVSTFLIALTLPGAIIVSLIFFPIFLPWLPGRYFSVKGASLGLLYSAIIVILTSQPITGLFSFILILTPIVSFTSLNFTGSTTFTSQSGVMRETKISLPIMTLSFIFGILINITSSIIQLLR